MNLMVFVKMNWYSFIPRNYKMKSNQLPVTNFSYQTKYSFIYTNILGIIVNKEITSDRFDEKGYQFPFYTLIIITIEH